jgi:hypothetical protein
MVSMCVFLPMVKLEVVKLILCKVIQCNQVSYHGLSKKFTDLRNKWNIMDITRSL